MEEIALERDSLPIRTGGSCQQQDDCVLKVYTSGYTSVRLCERGAPSVSAAPFSVHLVRNSFSGAYSTENLYYAKSSPEVCLLISQVLNADCSSVYRVTAEPFPF